MARCSASASAAARAIDRVPWQPGHAQARELGLELLAEARASEKSASRNRRDARRGLGRGGHALGGDAPDARQRLHAGVRRGLLPRRWSSGGWRGSIARASGRRPAARMHVVLGTRRRCRCRASLGQASRARRQPRASGGPPARPRSAARTSASTMRPSGPVPRSAALDAEHAAASAPAARRTVRCQMRAPWWPAIVGRARGRRWAWRAGARHDLAAAVGWFAGGRSRRSACAPPPSSPAARRSAAARRSPGAGTSSVPLSISTISSGSSLRHRVALVLEPLGDRALLHGQCRARAWSRVATRRSALPVHQRPRRRHQVVHLRQRRRLEHGAVRHRHVAGADAQRRRVEIVERGLHDAADDLGAVAAARVRLVADDQAAGLLDRLDDRLARRAAPACAGRSPRASMPSSASCSAACSALPAPWCGRRRR